MCSDGRNVGAVEERYDCQDAELAALQLELLKSPLMRWPRARVPLRCVGVIVYEWMDVWCGIVPG